MFNFETLKVLCKVNNGLDLAELVERDLFGVSSESDEGTDAVVDEAVSSVESDLFGKRAEKAIASAAQRERLKQCIKCVGVERGKGSNIKNSASYCNNICKRNVQFGNFRPKGK